MKCITTKINFYLLIIDFLWMLSLHCVKYCALWSTAVLRCSNTCYRQLVHHSTKGTLATIMIVLYAFWFYSAQVCLHKPAAAVVRGLFYIKMSGGGEGGREALVLLFLSLSRPSHLYLSHSVIEWDLCCWLYEYKARQWQWGVEAIYFTQIL